MSIHLNSIQLDSDESKEGKAFLKNLNRLKGLRSKKELPRVGLFWFLPLGNMVDMSVHMAEGTAVCNFTNLAMSSQVGWDALVQTNPSLKNNDSEFFGRVTAYKKKMFAVYINTELSDSQKNEVCDRFGLDPATTFWLLTENLV